MANNIKITKRDKFEQIRDLLVNLNNPDGFIAPSDPEMLVEFIDHEIELLNRKSSKSATETPAQKDNALLAVIIKDMLAECKNELGMTVGEILSDSRIACFATHDNKKVSSQKITSVLTPMTEPTEKYPNRTNEIINQVVKKVSYYRLNKVAE